MGHSSPGEPRCPYRPTLAHGSLDAASRKHSRCSRMAEQGWERDDYVLRSLHPAHCRS